MEEEQGTYQAEETAPTEIQTEAAPVTTQEQAPTGHKIKYNGVEEIISYDEAPTWIQKGKNYDKVNERAQQLEAQSKYLEKQAKIYGYSTVEEYTKAVDDYEQQQEIDQQAQSMNVDPETYAKYFAPVNQELGELRNKLTAYEQQEQQKEQQDRNSQSWSELERDYPHLKVFESFKEGAPDWYTPEMKEMVEVNGYKPLHAYKISHQETIFKQREQEVIAKLTGRDAKQVLSSVDSPNNLAFDPANMTGAQIDDISRRVRNGERIIF